jgi:hypothetical protein
MAPDLGLKCHFDLWKSLVPKGARVRVPPVSNVFFDSFISFLTLLYPVINEPTTGFSLIREAQNHGAKRSNFSQKLERDSCASEHAPGKGKGKDVLEAPHAGGRGAKEDETKYTTRRSQFRCQRAVIGRQEVSKSTQSVCVRRLSVCAQITLKVPTNN